MVGDEDLAGVEGGPDRAQSRVRLRRVEPGRVDRLKSVIPLRRGGTVEEVAGAVMWLFSDEAGYTSGSFIEVSGGN